MAHASTIGFVIVNLSFAHQFIHKRCFRQSFSKGLGILPAIEVAIAGDLVLGLGNKISSIFGEKVERM